MASKKNIPIVVVTGGCSFLAALAEHDAMREQTNAVERVALLIAFHHQFRPNNQSIAQFVTSDSVDGIHQVSLSHVTTVKSNCLKS